MSVGSFKNRILSNGGRGYNVRRSFGSNQDGKTIFSPIGSRWVKSGVKKSTSRVSNNNVGNAMSTDYSMHDTIYGYQSERYKRNNGGNRRRALDVLLSDRRNRSGRRGSGVCQNVFTEKSSAKNGQHNSLWREYKSRQGGIQVQVNKRIRRDEVGVSHRAGQTIVQIGPNTKVSKRFVNKILSTVSAELGQVSMDGLSYRKKQKMIKGFNDLLRRGEGSIATMKDLL